VSKLSIGLVTSPSEESDQLIKLLEKLGIEISYHISPDEISPEHIQNESLNVWLLNVNDDDWHDNIDQLLDESEASIYFNEPGNLTKQSHPEYWCKNLVSRLYELTGIDEGSGDQSSSDTPNPDQIASEASTSAGSAVSQSTLSQDDSLTSALDELETNSVGIPSDIAADLVSELETISPELEASIEESSVIDAELKRAPETSQVTSETIEIGDVVEPEPIAPPAKETAESKNIAKEELAAMEKVNQSVDSVEQQLESTDLILEQDSLSLDDSASIESQETDLNGELDEAEIILESQPDEQLEMLDSLDDTPSELDDDNLDDFSLDDESLDFESESIDFDSDPLELDSEASEMNTEQVSPVEYQSGLQTDKEEAEIRSETADISDEIMQLAESDESSNSDSRLATGQFPADEKIDLSAEVNSVLESARESDVQSNNSVFDVNLEDEEGNSLEVVQDRAQAMEFLSDFESVTESDSVESQQTSAASLESDQPKIEIEMFEDFDDEPKAEASTETNIETESVIEPQLNLSSDDELDFAISEAELLLESEISESSQTQQNASQEPESEEYLETDFQYDTGGLELESIDKPSTEKVTGKAVFIDESAEAEEKKQQAEVEFELADDSGLTLESIGDEPPAISGRAQFAIDDEVKETDQIDAQAEKQAELPAQQSESSDQQQQESTQTDNLINQEQAEEDNLLDPSLSSEMLEEMEPELEPIEAEKAIDLPESQMDLQQHTVELDEPETFEIPMLDDAAMGLDFEEPSQPVVQQKAELCPCWVIGASLGGPAAVKRFLQSLPKDINASFIITQHIDENFLPVLAEILTTSSQFEVTVANGSNAMSAGKIYLAPLNGKAIFLQDGSMLIDRSQKWSEPYSPCIDDVIESLSAVYKEKSGAIIFSGMGQDGLKGAKKMKELGGQIWAQSVDTCANPSMPDAVISESLTDVVASPEMLAEQLASHLTVNN
jgi:chemotaxis response regulator CheB